MLPSIEASVHVSRRAVSTRVSSTKKAIIFQPIRTHITWGEWKPAHKGLTKSEVLSGGLPRGLARSGRASAVTAHNVTLTVAARFAAHHKTVCCLSSPRLRPFVRHGNSTDSNNWNPAPRSASKSGRQLHAPHPFQPVGPCDYGREAPLWTVW